MNDFIGRTGVVIGKSFSASSVAPAQLRALRDGFLAKMKDLKKKYQIHFGFGLDFWQSLR